MSITMESMRQRVKWSAFIVLTPPLIAFGIVFLFSYGVAFYISNYLSTKHFTNSTTSTINPSIVNPSVASIFHVLNNTFPFMALLHLYRTNNTAIDCGGTLIDKNHILTAAHCVNDANSTDILLGIIDLNNTIDKITRKSTCFVIHQDYDNETLANDIALIYLEESVLLNTVQLSNLDDIHIFYESPQVYVLGWALTNPNEGLDSKLHIKDVQITNSKECFLAEKEKNMSSIICARALSFDAPCRGDSGGPLLLRDRKSQVGILSRGESVCNLSNPMVFTAVRFYRKWITDNKKPSCN